MSLPKYQLKAGVSLVGIQLPMRLIIKRVARVYEGHGKVLVITAGTEKPDDHGAGSYHPFGYAIDIRVNYFVDGGESVYKELQAFYENKAVTVIFHKGHHIHIHFNA